MAAVCTRTCVWKSMTKQVELEDCVTDPTVRWVLVRTNIYMPLSGSQSRFQVGEGAVHGKRTRVFPNLKAAMIAALSTDLTGTVVMYKSQPPMHGLHIMSCRSSPINKSTSGAAAEVTMGRAKEVILE